MYFCTGGCFRNYRGIQERCITPSRTMMDHPWYSVRWKKRPLYCFWRHSCPDVSGTSDQDYCTIPYKTTKTRSKPRASENNTHTYQDRQGKFYFLAGRMVRKIQRLSQRTYYQSSRKEAVYPQKDKKCIL